MQIQKGLFKRKLDNHQLIFAVGEAIAHAHYLVAEGNLVRETDRNGVHWFHSQNPN